MQSAEERAEGQPTGLLSMVPSPPTGVSALRQRSTPSQAVTPNKGPTGSCLFSLKKISLMTSRHTVFVSLCLINVLEGNDTYRGRN